MRFLSYMIVFLFGVIIDATDYQSLVKEVKWTDIITALATIVTTIVVYVTYSKWLESKKREDAYQTSKNYISCLVNISDLLGELMYPFDVCVPQEGSMVINREQSNSLLANSNEAIHKLITKAKELARIKSELGFWSVRLAPELERNHNKLLHAISNVVVVADVLQKQVVWFYNVEESHLNAISNEFDKLKDRVYIAEELLNSRYSRKYEGCFVYD